jgi:K+-transporting ATPase ATPase C chain
VIFPNQANGSLLTDGKGKVIGSEFIGQSFNDPKYFWGRPSATSPNAYNAAASSGSNLGTNNPALIDAVKGRIETLKAVDADNKAPIPVDLITASGSGLDPHISVAAVNYQINRVAKTRHIHAKKLRELIEEHTESRQLGFLGEPRVNVLKLNLALDSLE